MAVFLRLLLACLFGLLTVFFSVDLKAQITVNSALTPEEMIVRRFVGKGVTVSNITYVGLYSNDPSKSQFGTFTVGNDPPGFFPERRRGLILSSGFAGCAAGRNANGDADRFKAPDCDGLMYRNDVNATPSQIVSDADLNRLLSGPDNTTDAATIEFDFIPSSDTLKFRYIFASEEYQEWVDTVFNDIFAFFIRGGTEYPGLTNIALIPGTNLPVSINNINQKDYPQYFISNQCPGECIFPATGPFQIKYDGFTTVLEARAIVTPCITYHFKIAIADVKDDRWDSAVFLEDSSFSSPTDEVVAEGGFPLSGDTVTTFESCNNNVKYVFRRERTELPIEVPLLFGGTAVKDIDYTTDKNTVRFEVGQKEAEVNINVSFDRFVEGSEFIEVKYKPPFICDTLRAYINILDLDTTLEVTPPDTGFCSETGQMTVQVRARINNGFTDLFNFEWRNKQGVLVSTLPTFPFTVDRDTVLYVTVRDTVCGAPAQTDSAVIRYSVLRPGRPLTSALRDTFICEGQDLVLTPRLSNDRAGIAVEWRDAGGAILSRERNLTLRNITEVTQIELFARDEVCNQEMTKRVNIGFSPPITFTPLQDVRTCARAFVTFNPEARGSRNLVYEWRNLNTNQIIARTPVLRTTFDTDTRVLFTVRDSCFTETDEADISVIPEMEWQSATASKPENVCLNDEVRLSVSVTGGTGTYTYEWTSGEKTPEIRTVITDESAIGVVISDGCTVKDTTFFFTPLSRVQIVSLADTAICAGSELILEAKVRGKVTSVVWRNETGNRISDLLTVRIIVNNSQNYIFSATDSCGNTVSDTVRVNVVEIPLVNLPATVRACTGQPLKLRAALTAGGENCRYEWSPIEGLDNPFSPEPNVTILTSATYTLTVSCGKCISSPQTIAVQINPLPEVQFRPATLNRCSGDNGIILNPIVLGGANIIEYRWSPAAGLSSTTEAQPTARPEVSTNYNLIVKDVNGCESVRGNVRVEVAATPSGTIAPEYRICAGSPGVRLHPQINFFPSDDTEYLTYEWTPFFGLSDNTIREPIATPDFTVTYTLRVRSMPSGCENTVPIVSRVTVLPAPLVDAGPDREVCPSGNTLLGLPPNAQDEGVRYFWSPITGLQTPNAKQTLASPKHTTVYFLTAEKDGCRSAADSVRVTVRPAPTVSVVNKLEICPGQRIQLSSQVGSGFEPYTYQWLPTTGLNDPTLPDPEASPQVTTVYTLIVSTPHCSAQFTDSTRVTVLPDLVADADGSSSDNVFAVREGVPTEIPAVSNINERELRIEWSPASGLSRTDVLRPRVTLTGEDVLYTLTVSRGNCTTSSQVLVRVNSKPVIIKTNDPIGVCEGETVRAGVLPVVGNVEYDWQPRNLIIRQEDNIFFAAPKTTQTYTLIVTDRDFGQKDTATITVKIFPKPVARPESSPAQSCERFSVRFSDRNLENTAWSWDFGDSTPVSNARSPEHFYEKPGIYRVRLKVRNLNGCEDSVIFRYRVRLKALGEARFFSFPELPTVLQLPDAGVTFTDSSVGAVNHYWDFGDGSSSEMKNPTHVFQIPGEFAVTLTITDSSGCRHSFTKGSVLVERPDIVIPNIFTPNNDGINDVWFPVYSGEEPLEMTITDRWGVHMFSGLRGDKWDGRHADGKLAAEGTYFYLIKVGRGTSARFYRGDVSLMR